MGVSAVIGSIVLVSVTCVSLAMPIASLAIGLEGDVEGSNILSNSALDKLSSAFGETTICFSPEASRFHLAPHQWVPSSPPREYSSAGGVHEVVGTSSPQMALNHDCGNWPDSAAFAYGIGT